MGFRPNRSTIHNIFVMHGGEELVHIWFVFGIFELVVNFGNFKRKTRTC